MKTVFPRRSDSSLVIRHSSILLRRGIAPDMNSAGDVGGNDLRVWSETITAAARSCDLKVRFGIR